MKVSELKEGQLVAVRVKNRDQIQCAMALFWKPLPAKKTVRVGVAIKEPIPVKGGVPGGPQKWTPQWVFPNQILDTWDRYVAKLEHKANLEQRQRDAALKAQTRFQQILDTLKARGVVDGVYVDRRNKRVSGVALDFTAAEQIIQMLEMVPKCVKWVDGEIKLVAQ